MRVKLQKCVSDLFCTLWMSQRRLWDDIRCTNNEIQITKVQKRVPEKNMKDSENKSKEGVIFKADTETFKKKNDVRYIL